MSDKDIDIKTLNKSLPSYNPLGSSQLAFNYKVENINLRIKVKKEKIVSEVKRLKNSKKKLKI